MVVSQLPQIDVVDLSLHVRESLVLGDLSINQKMDLLAEFVVGPCERQRRHPIFSSAHLDGGVRMMSECRSILALLYLHKQHILYIISTSDNGIFSIAGWRLPKRTSSKRDIRSYCGIRL